VPIGYEDLFLCLLVSYLLSSLDRAMALPSRKSDIIPLKQKLYDDGAKAKIVRGQNPDTKAVLLNK
jgi:hypothetical protein